MTRTAPINLAIKVEDADAIYRLLVRMKASELSDLRRVQTQLSVYGDRRASMEGEPAVLQARLVLLEDLIAQVNAQR
jgi:hypothetical protein